MDSEIALSIGIDPGTNTGVAVWDISNKRFLIVSTMPIHRALFYVLELRNTFGGVYIRIEDARMRKWFGDHTRGKEQGAGSIKRDCSIWEDFCKDNDLAFEMVNPGTAKTKITSAYFKKITGYEKQTSEHARDAAMLVLNHKPR